MLEARNIRKVYYNGNEELEVLKGINLRVGKGEFVAVVGPSGAGKSTLLHILGGLDMPTSGEIVFEEKNIYGLNDAQLSAVRNKKVGFVFQFYHLLPEFTVLENVAMPALASPEFRASNPKLKEEARKLVEEVGLGDRIKHFPGQLSGGEKQRVAIARALINKPGLLLCDEPTGNLDSKTSEEIVALVKKFNLENRMTVVLVTHNMELARSAQVTYHLRDGVLVN